MKCHRQDSNSRHVGYMIRLTIARTIEPTGHIILGTLVVYNVSAACRELKRKLFNCRTGGDQDQLTLAELGPSGIRQPDSENLLEEQFMPMQILVLASRSNAIVVTMLM